MQVATELVSAFSEVRQHLEMLDGLSKAMDENSAGALITQTAFQNALHQVC